MNSPLAYACGTYSQLMTLAKFPTHIVVPIMFSWPGGTIFAFGRARTVALDKAWQKDFEDFVLSLHREQGFEIFHILGHSMGRL
jgi:esterase/lipase superfamily enzyme